MFKLKDVSVGALALVLLVGCSSIISLRDAYPTHYGQPLHVHHNRIVETTDVTVYQDYLDLPHGVYEALPPRFRVAALTDHLLVLRDNTGDLRFRDTTNMQSRARHSEGFTAKARELRDHGMVEHRLPGYLNMIAFIDDIDYDAVIDDEHNEAWRNWIDEFKANENSLTDLSQHNIILERDVASAAKALGEMEREAMAIQGAIAGTRASADEWERRARELGATGQILAAPIGLRAIDIPYSYNEDPLRTAYDWQPDFRLPETTWQTSGINNPHMHAWTHDAYANFSDRMNNPRQYYDPASASRIELLTTPTIVSMTRSPLHQATLTDNPSAAGWMSSDHAVGLSIDLRLNSTNYDVRGPAPPDAAISNYQLLVRVLNDSGFVRTEAFSNADERNHFTVARTARKENGQDRLDIGGEIAEARYGVQAEVFRRLSESANAAGEDLAKQIGDATEQNQGLMDRASELSTEIAKKRDEISANQKELARQREREKKWKKLFEQYQRRGSCSVALLSSAEIDRQAQLVEYQMNALHNSVKHWDCADWGPGRGRCP